MKVLLVNKYHYLKGGSERYYFTLASLLKESGHEVIFFAMENERNFPCNQEKYFVKNASMDGDLSSKIRLVSHLKYSSEAYKKMTKLLSDEKPDLVILNLVHKQLTLSIVKAIKDYDPSLKIVWVMHDLITVCPSYTMLDANGNICSKCLDKNFYHCVENRCIKGSKLKSYLSYIEAKYILKKQYYNLVDLYITPSRCYQKILKDANFTTSRIEYLPNPLSIDFPYGVNDDHDDYYLYFGRLSFEKGVSLLTSVFKELPYKLKIAGEGDIKINNPPSNIEYLGYKSGDELISLVKKAKAIIVPSIWLENAPYSVLEALALGKILIVSNYGGLPELVDDGVNGFIFTNKEELILSINKVENLSKDEYKKMSKASLDKALKITNGKQYVSKLLDLVNRR